MRANEAEMSGMQSTRRRVQPWVDEVTGEVTGAPSPRRRRFLTDAERAERDRVLADRKAQRSWMRALANLLCPSLVAEDDPTLHERGPIDVSRARAVKPLLRLPRVSGQGYEGSALVADWRDYDGNNGGEPREYVRLAVEFFDGAGHKGYFPPVAVRGSEWRALGRMFTELADARDAATSDGAGR
jgi:hypothetical protein